MPIRESDITFVGCSPSDPLTKRTAELLVRDYDKMMSGLHKFTANANWIADNREALRKDHGGMYVAVCDEKICASNKDHSTLLDEVEKKYSEMDGVRIEYISKQRTNLLF